MYQPKICPICGMEFIPKSAKQKYCKREITLKCKVCGIDYIGYCQPDNKTVCDNIECKKRAASIGCKNLEQKTKICRTCGKLFVPTFAKQLDCNEMTLATCEVCGKSFYRKCNKYVTTSTCSEECKKALARKGHKQFYSNLTRKCELCGKLFTPTTNTQKYCTDQHYRTCEVCGKSFPFDHRKLKADWPRTCSTECSLTLRFLNGNPFSDELARKKAVRTLLSRYGVCHPMNSKQIKNKVKQTNLNNHGGQYFQATSEWRNLVVNKSRLKYGTDWPIQNQDIRAFRDSQNLKKYGVTNVASLDSSKQKAKLTLLSKYGKMSFPQTLAWKRSVMLVPEKAETFEKFTRDPRSFILSNFEEKPSVKQLSDMLGVADTTVSCHLRSADCSDLVRINYSNLEVTIKNYLQSISPNIKIISNCRSIIAPYEIDIYLPELKLGIECNPTVTHNSSVSDPWGQPPKDSKYHQMKTDMCESHGVRLIHLFGYEWNHKRAIMESILRNVLGKNDRRIYARKCELRAVSYTDSKVFLNANHRQGFANSSVRLGLYYQDELVSLMTFGKIRRTIGANKDVDGWELIRFCNALNTSVVGGASRLFKHFVDTYHPEVVLSFSDRAHTTGKLYQTLGFTEKSRSAPGYVWVDELTDVAYNRVNAQKHNLKKFLNDDNIDLTKTEAQIMEEHGFVRVYDSGVITWQWNKPMK